MPAVVLVHGLLGWGEERPFYGLAPTYFPLQHLRRMWHQGSVVAVDVGIASSDHDCACEAFAQLLGLRVDYGEVHSSDSDHVRFGTIYETALLDQWDATRPIHLVGHCFGGNTAIALCNLIAEDYWGIGTGPDWVLSVTCICSPLRGCSLPAALGFALQEGQEKHAPARALSSLRPLAMLCQLALGAQKRWPWLLRPLFNTRMDRLQQQSTCSDTMPRKHRVLHGQLDNLCNTYLIAVIAGSLEPLAPLAVMRKCAPFLCLAAASWVSLLFTAWRTRRRLRAELQRLLALRWVRQAAVGWICWSLASPCLALLTLCEPRLKKHRAALGLRLQVAMEPLRPFLHTWLAHPLLRLSAWAFGGENDGIVGVMSQRGFDALSLGHIVPLSCEPQSEVSNTASGDLESQALERGRWHVIHAPGADHCLGTWLDPYFTPHMYADLFGLLLRSNSGYHAGAHATVSQVGGG